MLYPAMSELLKNVDSRYLLVNVVAHRARQLSIESELTHEPLEEKPVTLAIREVAEGKLIAEIDFDSIAKAEEAKTKWNAKHINVNSLFAD